MKKLFLGLAILAFASCKKDKKEDAGCPLSEATLSGSYKISTIMYKPSATSPEVNFFDVFPQDDCAKDDVTTFKSDHTVAYTDAGTVCSPDNSATGT